MRNTADGNLAALKKYEREQDALYKAQERRDEQIIEMVDEYLADLNLLCEAFSEIPHGKLKEMVKFMQKAEMANSDYAFECDAHVGKLVRSGIIDYLENLAESELDQ